MQRALPGAGCAAGIVTPTKCRAAACSSHVVAFTHNRVRFFIEEDTASPVQKTLEKIGRLSSASLYPAILQSNLLC